MEDRIRSRKDVKHIFDSFLVFGEIWPPNPILASKAPSPRLLFSFPPAHPNNTVVKAANHFVFPCNEEITTIEHFTFVITTESGRWKFGYCRQEPRLPSIKGPVYNKCSVFVSEFPYWNGVFYKALNYLAGVSKWAAPTKLFLELLHEIKIPTAPQEWLIDILIPGYPAFQSTCPRDDILLPTLKDRCLSEFYNAFTAETMMILFASILAERNIVLTSKRLSTLSSVVLACNIILRPLCWQHIFIPVLPQALADYLEAPIPFIIGVTPATWKSESAKRKSCQSRCVHVDADIDTVISPFPNDLNSIPKDILTFLKSNLKAGRNNMNLIDNCLANTFLQIFIKVMGHYENALIFTGGQTRKFDEETFLRLAKTEHRPFLKSTFLRSQMFQQFLDERIAKGLVTPTDLFHNEIHREEVIAKPDLIDLSFESRVQERNKAKIKNDFQFSPPVKVRDPKALQGNYKPFFSTNQVESSFPIVTATPTPKPRPNPKSGFTRTQTVDPPLLTKWNNVLDDLKANPVHLKVVKRFSTSTNTYTLPHQLNLTQENVEIREIAKPPIPIPPKPKRTFLSSSAPAQQQSEKDLIDFDAPPCLVNNINNNSNNSNRFDMEALTLSYPNEVLKVYKSYLKDVGNGDLLF